MIIAVAIQRNGKTWSLPQPARHHNLILYMVQHGEQPPINRGGAFGFLNDSGEFLDRSDALKYAKKTKQVDKKLNLLTSEDLW